MNKLFLKRMALGLGLLTLAGQAGAQIAPFSDGNFAADYVGARFSITAPPAIKGIKEVELANDGSGTANQWGGLMPSPLVNIPIARAYGPALSPGPGNDSLGTGPLQNGVTFPSLAGKYALIFRGGGVTFTRKAKICQDAGAIGCIIVNNIPGSPVGMAETAADGPVTIPVMMISDVDGIAINNQLRGGTAVTFSFSSWGFNYQHDLGILPTGAAMGHAFAIPTAQMAPTNGNPAPYKFQTGAFIANYGTAGSESSVVLKSIASFTPTGGSATVVHADSVAVGNFNRIDSILIPTVATPYDLHATQNGRIDQVYTVSMANADSNLSDNSVTASTYLTDSIFSKARFDFVKNTPVSNIGYQISGGAPFVWGPLYYVAKGGYAMRKVQMAISQNGDPMLDGTAPVNINVFKWEDIDGNQTMDLGEVSLIGSATKTFNANDSSGKFFTADITNLTNGTLKTTDNTWYWIAAEMPGGTTFLAADGVTNYYSRSYTRKRASNYAEYYAPLLNGVATDVANGAAVPIMVPFERDLGVNILDSSRYAEQNKGLVPSIALYLSKNVVTSVSTTSKGLTGVELYPNPASSFVTVDLNFSTTSSKVYLTVIDASGRFVAKDVRNNVTKDKVTFKTDNFASGQYYIMVNADQGNIIKKFTVVSK